MGDRSKQYPYAHFRSRLVQKAPAEKKRMEIDELQKAAYQSSALPATHCYSSDISRIKSGLWSGSEPSWRKLSETSKTNENQKSLHPLSKEFVSFSSFGKTTEELETNIYHVQPSRIPSPPFLLDHIENEDQFLYDKCDSSPAYQTRATSLSSFPVRQSPVPKKTESGGWSDDDDLLPVQSGCSKTPADFTYGQENVATKDLKFSRPTHTWKKYEQTESTNIADVSKNSSRFDVFQDNSPEFLKPKVSCNKELSRTLPHISKLQNKNDYFGLIPSSDSTSKPSIRDIASLLKNLKLIQALRNQNVEPEALLQTPKIDDMSDNLAPKPLIRIQNQITLNLKNKTSNSTSGTEMLLTQKDCTSKSQVSEAVRKQSAYDNQNTAAMFVSQFLQKLSTKQGNREICQKAKHVSKTVSNTQKGCSGKNSSQGKAYEKESSHLPKKFGTDSLQKSTLSRTRKRSTNSDYPILECSKKSRGTESLAKKHWSQGDTEEQSNKPGKLLKGSLKKESFNIKEGGIRGILKVKAQDKGPEELSFGKTHNENSSDISTARFDKSPREKSHDMCSRRWSRSPRRKLRGRSPRRTSADRSPRRRSRGRSPRRTSADRSPRRRSRGRSPRRTSADRTPRRKSLGRSPRKRSRSRKRSADRSPERRSRSCKRRSRDRSPRHKSCGRTARMQSCSRRRQSADRTPEKQPCDRSPHKGPHSDGLRRLPQNNSTALCAGKNPEIKTETNKISKQLQHENNPDLSPCGGESLSSSVRDQRFDKNLEMLKKKKNACDRDSSPQSPMIPSPENIRLGDFLRKKDHNENKKSDMRNKHTAMAPCVSKEIKTKCDPVDSAEILALQHEEENSDGKSVALKQFSEKKVVKKSPKVDPTSTDSLSSSLGAVNSSHSVQPELLQLAPTAAPVTSEPCSQYSEPSVQNYQAAYQPSAYGDVADPSTYSYYMNTLPYMPYSGYDTSSYNMYTSQYPMENQLQQSVCYSDYYAETPVPHKQIPVFNPTVPPQENHLSKKALRKRKALPKKNALPKKECRRQAVLVQVDSSTHDTSNKSELIVEKRSKSRIGERDKGQSNKKEENEGQVVKEKYPGETRRDKNEDRIDTKATGEDRSEKKGKGECETEKEDRRYDKSEHKGKESQEDVITPDEERELLSCKAEVQKQMENLNSEYITMSKLSAIFTVQMFKGEMMRKMCHEKDGHKDHIITAYGRLQDEIKVQLANLTSAVKDIDKELRKKVSTVESSTPRIEGEFSKKSLLAEKITKGKFLSTMVEVIPENAEFYDPGGHWCQSCNKLVPTVCAMLLHLKSEEHKEHMDHLDRPWFSKSFKKIRNRCEVDINKSYPIKGVQFVMPVDGFYCSLCKLTFPDSSVAEDHIGGREHNAAYKKLITENPIYERRIILDRLAGVAIIHKEEYKRRLEAEKELANKKKRQEEEEEEQTFGKANGKNKEEVDHLVSSKASLQSERKNAIKLTLLENKKIKCGNRSAGDGKPKQTIVYIGRAPNYKPRTHEHFSSKASRSADGTCNMDSSPERNLFQNVLEEDQNFKKDLPVEKSQDVVSDQKDADNSDPYKNLRKTSYKICENTSEAPNSASEQRSATGHDFDDSRNARGSFVLVPAVLQNSSVSTGQPADNLKAKEVCSQNIVTADLSTASKTDRLTAPPRSSEKNNAKGQTKKTAVQIHGPLTEEEADLLLLGINKDDQLPLAIPKPPPSVISSKSNVALPTEITDTQQGITEPTTENIHAEPYVATHLSSVTCSGAVCATSQASNTLSSVVSKIPTIPICPVTHAGVTTAKESQDQSLAYYPSFQITTAKIQGNTLQKSNTTTVQAIVSQKTSITSIESNISHRPGISTVESNILENPQNQNSTVCTQSCSVMQGSISHSPDVTCVKIQTEFGSSLPVTCTSDAQSNLLTSADVEKPCKGALKGQETFLYPTVFSSVLSNTCGNIGNSLESSQENIQGSTPPPPVADNCPSKSSDNADVLYNVSLEPPNMNYANKENVPAVQQGSVIQQEFAPISCNVSLIPTSFPPAEQPKSDPHTQTSPVEQENVTQQLVASYSTDIGSNTVTSLSSPKATSVRYSDHYKSSPVPGKISETSANPSNIQNPPSGQGTVLLPLVTSCVSSSVQSNGALENISHPPPVAVQGDAPLFPLPNLSTSSPANLIAPGIVPQPPQNVSYPRQSAPLIQGNVMQQQTVNCNPAIPGIPPLENVPCPPVVRYPPNLRGNSAVLANISHPPPNIRLYHNQSAPNVPGNNRKQSLQRGHCIPAAPGNISQPPPNMNHPQNQLIQLTPGDVSKSPPVIHPGNICVPPVPGTIFHSRNQCGSMILSSVSQPPPDISCTGTHPAPPVFGSTSQSPPRMSHCGPGIPGNVSHPPGLQNTVSGQISLRPHFSNYGRVTEPLNVPMQPSIYSTLPGQCIPVSINSVSDSSPNSTKNHIPAKIESSQGEVKSTSSSLAVTESKSSLLVCGRGGRQSREWSDVQNSEQVVSLLNKVHVTSVSVTTSSEEKSVKYQYLSCGTNSFHPAPPGTEPVPILQSSSLSPEKDPSTSQELSEHISEKIESHLEVGVEISVANETSKTDSVVSFDECVEQCLGVNTSVCSEKLGGNAQDVKSKDLCCHPKPQEKCSDLENDTVLGFDCTMSSRSESLGLSPDKAGNGTQSICEKIESHLEMGVEISVANVASKTDSVVSFDECVEQCLGVNTSVCSEKLGGNAQDVKSKDLCCHPKSQEKCSDLENDTVLGYDCTMSTRSESLGLSPDKAGNGTQSICEKIESHLEVGVEISVANEASKTDSVVPFDECVEQCLGVNTSVCSEKLAGNAQDVKSKDLCCHPKSQEKCSDLENDTVLGFDCTMSTRSESLGLSPDKAGNGTQSISEKIESHLEVGVEISVANETSKTDSVVSFDECVEQCLGVNTSVCSEKLGGNAQDVKSKDLCCHPKSQEKCSDLENDTVLGFDCTMSTRSESLGLSPDKAGNGTQSISEKIESHLEVGVEISVANETSKTDSVVSFDECVEQCLGVNTSVCSEQLGGNAQNVKSKDLCCHPKSQEKCSDLENDTVLGFDCTMSTRSESLGLSPDKAGNGTQSISEKIESHLEVGVEISAANETSKTDSVVPFDECVEQCLGVNTSVCSEQLGGNAQDVKSKDLCCHPKSQEKCSDLENDTVLGFDCTMSTRSESLGLSPDKAGNGTQSICEKIESHLEVGVEISVANEASKTDSVVSFDECVEQCLGVNTSVCSEKLGGNAQDVKSKDLCCHPKSKEKCSDLENDNVLGFECTMSTRSESLGLSPDKAGNGTQSVIVTTASTRSREFSENKNSGFCRTSEDVLNSGLLVHGSITDQKETRLPSTSVKNMSETSQRENVTQENKNCFHTESKELKESTNTAQNNDLVHCGQNFNLHSLPLFKIPHSFQQHGSVSTPAVSSFNEGPSRIVPLPESSLNPAPPGTNTFHESQPSITTNDELQKPAPELYINPSSSFPTSTYEKPVQTAEKDTRVTVTKESDAYSSLPPELVSTEKASTVVNSSVSFTLEQVHTKNVESVKIHVDGTDNTVKVCTAEELINREIRFITENTDKHICISSSSNPFSRRLKCEAQKTDSEVRNVAENYNNCNENIANQNSEGTKISQNVPDLTQSKGEVMKGKYIMKPENFAKGQNKNSFNVQSGAEDHTQQLPAGSSPCDFLNNNTVFSTQSNTVHNFSPWFQSSSCQMHSSSPHLVSVPSSFHQSFTKHRLTPQSSDFLNPPPPGTDPLSDFQIAQNCESPQSTLGHSEGSQESVSNKFNELVSEKVEMSMVSLDISKESTEESSVSTCASRQSQNDFMKMESPLVSAEDVVCVTPNVNAKSAEAWEMCDHPVNIVVKSHPSDQYDDELGFQDTKKESSHATETSEPETQHVNVPSKGDSPGHSRKSETSTSGEQDKTEEFALGVPSAESEETFEGVEVSSHC